MNTLLDRTEQDVARERIEQAFRDFERCTGCGRDMKVVERASGLRIECASLASKTRIRYALASGLHDSHLIELPEGILAVA